MRVLFRIYFQNAPLLCRNDRCAHLWGSMVVTVIDVDTEGANMRARVIIDVTETLCRGVRVLMKETMHDVSILIQYEYLRELCFRCSLIVLRTRFQNARAKT
ncbi:hypothetical protein TorRG33x02_339470 [Trema orientale]|uniref:Uncharacterized protein n=1 Tax=Trema orientale TaxID=63057 RepID=A0A2P5AWD6_TREOI|nr:hypothetical protein TorRG33x02_339470 [Trema orientale]